MATDLEPRAATGPIATAAEVAAHPAFDRMLDGLVLTIAADPKSFGDFAADIAVEVKAFAAEVAGPRPSPIESALATTAALCWLATRHAEAVAAGRKGATFQQARHDQNRLDRAIRRYLATLRTLALVRRAARPSVRIVANQANVVAVNGGGALPN